MFLQIDPSWMFDLVRNVTLDDNTKCSCTDSVVLSWHLDKNELNILPRQVKSYEGVQTNKQKKIDFLFLDFLKFGITPKGSIFLIFMIITFMIII